MDTIVCGDIGYRFGAYKEFRGALQAFLPANGFMWEEDKVKYLQKRIWRYLGRMNAKAYLEYNPTKPTVVAISGSENSPNIPQ
ncbi:hypothetical protein E1B28_011760 [Marasmius oreades]|uniref:Uncharacterized protein n=1 Tax=Marasmius oreades TaxID=181124 RepID=A0A9P7UPX7_9AGAR|nr:uncharacterized protein E1B28_011760 [Marasmius oreades]KAG7090152.1 hypothetical protein E1B28_011760 [Marasmius oreades]